jgi:tRNA pseudouridine38-40 synthase
MRRVDFLRVSRRGDLVVIDIQANAFLHHMVRNIAGVLIDIGAGKRPPRWALEVLQARDRQLGGVNASPHGLYFVGVQYPASLGMPDAAVAPQFW